MALILRLVWSQTETTRASLARETGLSRSTVSTLVETLLAQGLFEERGAGVSTGGRKPTLVCFNYEAKMILGVDLGANHIAVGVMNLNGSVKSWRTETCAVRDDPDAALLTLKGLSTEALREAQVREGQLLGVGLAVPSPVSRETPNKLSPLFMSEWRDVDLARDLELPEGVPLMIDNDANLGALAETWWGLGQSCDHIAFLKLGTGVGAGFVFDREIFRGHGGFAGELGHIVIDPQGKQCVCGLKGCLVTYVGAQELLTQANERLLESLRGESAPFNHLKDLLSALQAGDLIARDVITDAAQRLGLAVAGLMNMMNPERVILGGDLAAAGDALLHPLRERVNSRSPWTSLSRSQLLISQLGERAVMLGAATQVLQAALNQPHELFEI